MVADSRFLKLGGNLRSCLVHPPLQHTLPFAVGSVQHNAVCRGVFQQGFRTGCETGCGEQTYNRCMALAVVSNEMEAATAKICERRTRIESSDCLAVYAEGVKVTSSPGAPLPVCTPLQQTCQTPSTHLPLPAQRTHQHTPWVVQSGCVEASFAQVAEDRQNREQANAQAEAAALAQQQQAHTQQVRGCLEPTGTTRAWGMQPRPATRTLALAHAHAAAAEGVGVAVRVATDP
jgi:hypothetical protein